MILIVLYTSHIDGLLAGQKVLQLRESDGVPSHQGRVALEELAGQLKGHTQGPEVPPGLEPQSHPCHRVIEVHYHLS